MPILPKLAVAWRSATVIFVTVRFVTVEVVEAADDFPTATELLARQVFLQVPMITVVIVSLAVDQSCVPEGSKCLSC